MSLNLTIKKINNFFLILYVEISVLIGHIPCLFLTDSLQDFWRLFMKGIWEQAEQKLTQLSCTYIKVSHNWVW